MAEIIDQQGALVPEFAHLNVEQNTAIAIVRAEIDTQIATALRYPRKIQSIAARIMSYATMDEETAAECCYALVYGKKQRDQNGEEAGRQNDAVEGPSIRLAEIALQAFGNCRAYARVINVDRKNKFVEAEGIFHDLETNALQSATSRRAIAGQRGNLFPEHLIITTGNAACSIAKRNAILAGIPRGLYRPAYNEARKIIAGTAATLVTSRQKVVESYAHLGISAEQICVLLGIDSMMEFTVAHVVQMRAMFASIKSGEVRAEDAFAPPKPARQQPVQDPLSNEGVPDHADHSTASGSSQTDEQRSASREEALTKGADVGRSDQQHGIGPGVSDGGASGIRGTAEQSKPDNAGDGGKAAETGEEGR